MMPGELRCPPGGTLRSILLAAGIGLLPAMPAHSLAYKWSSGTEPYVSGSGSAVSFTDPDESCVNLALPFPFIYNGVSQSSVGVCSNGYLMFGTAASSMSNQSLFTAGIPTQILAPWWDDLNDSPVGSVQWFVSGNAPERVLTVQFKDYPDYWSGSNYRLNFQVHLHEAANRIRFVYGTKSGATPSASSSASIGIKGATGGSGDFLNGLTGSSTAGNGSLSSATGFPAPGTVFSFEPDTLIPANLAAAGNDGAVALKWSRVKAGGIARYRVYMGLAAGTGILRDSAANGDTIRTITGLVNATRYYFRVTAVDSAGIESGFSNEVSAIPTSPPFVKMSVPSKDTVLPVGAWSISLTAIAIDNDGTISKVEFYRDSVLIGTDTYSPTGQVFDYYWYLPASGSFKLTAKATDNHGAVTVSAPVMLYLNTAPTVSLGAPANGTAFVLGSDVPIMAIAADPDPDGSISRVEFYRDSVKLGEDSTAPYAFTWTAPPSGSYTLKAKAIDNLGTATTSSGVSIKVSKPPAVSIVNPAPDTVLMQAYSYPLKAMATDSDGTVYSVRFYEDTVLVGYGYHYSWDSAGVFTMTWYDADLGRHTLIAKTTDNAGLETVSAPVSFDINAAPKANLTSPVSGAVFVLGNDVPMAATASDTVGTIAKVEFYRDSVKLGEDSTAPYAFTWIAPPSGSYTLKAKAIDNLGTATTSSGVSIKVSKPPAVSIAIPAPDTVLMQASSQYLRAFATDSDGTVYSVRFYEDTVLVGYAYHSSWDSAGVFTMNWYYPALGRHTLIAKATDNAGLETVSAPVSFDINMAPKVSLTAPAPGALYALGTDIPMTATASDTLGTIAKVEFYRDSVKLGEDSTAPYAFTWTAPPSGYFSLKAKAIDNLGSAATSSAVNVRVSFPPVVTLTGPPPGAVLAYPGTVTFTVSATDPDGYVSQIELWSDTGRIAQASGSSLFFAWNDVPPGARQVYAKAIDNQGTTGVSAMLAFTLDRAPAVALGSPPPFSVFPVGAAIPLAASASDSDGSVARVDFFRDTVLLARDTVAPWTADWQNVPKGRYRLYAKATDNLGLSAVSNSVIVFVGDSGQAVMGGKLFITGHDADDHKNFAFMTAGLDYLAFGHAATGAEVAERKEVKIAYLGNSPPGIAAIGDYTGFTFIDIDLAGWQSQAFSPQAFRVLMIGSGADYVTSIGSDSLNAAKPGFEDYFNAGGALFVMTEQGLGQTFYDFLPTFANSQNSSVHEQNLGGVSGVFTVEPAGSAIGLTEAIVDMDITHTEFLGVDSGLFTVFETHNVTGLPVSIGADAIIRGNILVRPSDTVVSKPVAHYRDSIFQDTLCVRFVSATDGAQIRIALDGGNPDTSSLVRPNNGSICLDRGTTLVAIAEKPGLKSSGPAAYAFRKTGQVAVPKPADTARYFRDKLCVGFASATDSANLRYAWTGRAPDSLSPAKANGDTLCIDRTATLGIIGTRKDWKPSDPAFYGFIKMSRVAAPAASLADSSYFRDSVCVRLTSLTDSARIHYTLDGGDPDTSSLSVPNGGVACLDRTATLRAEAKRPNWIESERVAYTYVKMRQLPIPVADKADSLYFPDTLCIRFSTAIDGTLLRYTLDGGRADSSRLILPASQKLCLDRSATIRMVAVRPNWLNSEELLLREFAMQTVAPPGSDRADSTWFRDTLCFRLTSATPGAAIRYTVDGGRPDTSSWSGANGLPVCLDKTARVLAIGSKPDWKNSPVAGYTYLKMRKAGSPVPDRGDSVFQDRLCVRFTSSTPGAEIHYAVDGGDPDTASAFIRNGDALCTDRTVRYRLVAKLKNWVTSDTVEFGLRRQYRVEPPRSDRGDTVRFGREACINLSSETPGAEIRYLAEGTGEPRGSVANGGRVCVQSGAILIATATLPGWQVSESRRFVFLQDREGPVIISASKRAFNPGSISVDGNCAEKGRDTLVVTLSEPIVPRAGSSDWAAFLLVSPVCDTQAVAAFPLAAPPAFSDGGLKATIIVDKGAAAAIPKAGSCLYLDWRSAAFTDAVGNPPGSKGARLHGSDGAAQITFIRAVPSVVGMADGSGSPACSGTREPGTAWIPPVGFNPATRTVEPDRAGACAEGTAAPEAARAQSLPDCMAIIEVVSDAGYVADIAIFDHHGLFVKSFRQEFGRCGELLNRNRDAAGGKRSYLAWNLRDRHGQKAGNGVYLWRIRFHPLDGGMGNDQHILIRVGLIRNGRCAE